MISYRYVTIITGYAAVFNSAQRLKEPEARPRPREKKKQP